GTPSGLFVNTFDSIFLYFNRGQRLLLIDSDGKLIDEFGSLRSSNEDQSIPYIEVTARQPIVRSGNKLLFCTYEMEGLNEVAGAILNLDSREVLFPYQLPDIYSEGWWGGVVY